MVGKGLNAYTIPVSMAEILVPRLNATDPHRLYYLWFPEVVVKLAILASDGGCKSLRPDP